MLKISIRNEMQDTSTLHASGPIIIGRSPGDAQPGISVNDRFVSRQHVVVEMIDDRRIRVAVVGRTSVTLSDARILDSGAVCELTMPVQFVAGYTEIILASDQPTKSQGHDARLATIARPLESLDPSARNVDPSGILNQLSGDIATDKIMQWFEALLVVQRSAAGSSEFYEETARAVVDLIGLDRGMVVLLEADSWQTVASYSTTDQREPTYSETVLNEVLEAGRTVYESSVRQSEAQSLANIDAYVAAPIFSSGSIVGAIFGSRDLRSAKSTTSGIAAVEAEFVQVLAGAVSAGFARIDREAAAARLQVQFERFASTKLVRALNRKPELLEPQECEVTILFADIRSFSTIAEAIGPVVAYELIRDVMDSMTERIMDADGLIIDYAGDGLAAMWNAPSQQPQHAAMACDAAIAMLIALRDLDQQWSARIGTTLRMGIGVHTGKAMVGNSGSRLRLKYSPIGHCVNLASRIEGATKPLGVAALASSDTVSQAMDSRQREASQTLGAHATRRLGRIHVVGVVEPVEVYELFDGDELDVDGRQAYAKALMHFESQSWQAAANEADAAVRAMPSDRPSQLLAARITEAIRCAQQNESDASIDTLLNMKSK